MSGKLYSLILVLVLAGNGLFAQSYRHEIGAQSDNDSYLAQGSDRYYTNGIFLFYRKALKTDTSGTRFGKILGFEAGQKIFNPRSGYIPAQRLVDRPFAGYLYIGSNLNLLYKNESNLKLGLQLGIIGPAALGRETQDVIHSTFGFYPPDGWQYQIRNSFQLNFSAEYNRLLLRASWIDASLSSYANVGTGFTGAGAGPLLRFGDFNQLFNSSSTQSNVLAGTTGVEKLHAHEFFLYYKPLFNYVAYDATVQGNLFKDHNPASEEVRLDPEPIIISQQVGASYSSNRWTVDLSATFHTRDVKQMVRSHQWATAALLYRFN